MMAPIHNTENMSVKCGFHYGFPEGDKQDLNPHLIQLLDFRDQEPKVHIQGYVVNANTRNA